MKSIWHEVCNTIRRRPLLTCPVLIASSVNWCLFEGRKYFMRAMLPNLGTQHSVLSGGATSGSPNKSLMLLAGATVSTLSTVCTVALLVIAMLLIARLMARNPPEKFQPGIRDIVILILMVTSSASLLALVTIPIFYFIAWHPLTFVLGLSTTVTLAGIGYVATPTAMKLIAVQVNEEFREEQTRSGRVASYWTAAGIGALAWCQLLLAHSMSGDLAQRYAFSYAGTLIVDLPYAFFFVALTLICSGSIPEMPQGLDTFEN